MRVVNGFLFLSVICGIKASSASDVTCQVKTRPDLFDVGFSTSSERTFTTFCAFNDDISITEPSTLSNSLLENVTELVMPRNEKIEFLPQGSSASFPNLRLINAFGCSIKSINKLPFQGLTKLIKITLDKNKVETIDENSFEDLVNLRYLYLDDNKITELPTKTFASLENLDTLYLNGNQLTKLDADLFKNNKKIALLHINNNKLETLPAGIFDGFKLMRQLWLKSNKIVDLPPHIFDQCESLVDLSLSHNNIKRIDSNLLAKLSALNDVSFSFNPLEFIDLAIFDGNTVLTSFSFNGVATKDIRNIDKVDQMKRLNGIGFYESCVDGEFHEGNLDKLKEIVKSKCIVTA